MGSVKLTICVAISVIALRLAPRAEAAVSDIPVEVIEAYKNAYRAIQGYRYEYSCEASSPLGLEKAISLGYVRNPVARGEIIGKKDRLRQRHFRGWATPGEAESFDMAFDGMHLRQRPGDRFITDDVTRSVVMLFDKDDDLGGLRKHFFAAEPLDFCFFAVELPGISVETLNRAQFRVPEVFRDGNFASTTDVVEGQKCALLSSPSLKLWLDPSLGYAVRRREVYIENKLVFVVKADRIEPVAADVWIPRMITLESVGNPRNMYDGALEGVTTYINRVSISRFTLNPPMKDDDFVITPKAGEWVNDLSKKVVGASDGALGVSYLQPADPGRLDEVVAAAQSRRPSSNSNNFPPMYVLFLAFNGALVVALLVFVVSRRLRHP